jgi:hypothetical protein
MATPVQVFGAAQIQVSFFASNGSSFADPQVLGYSENGVEVSEEPAIMPVYSDETGGQQGVPFDHQYMGERHLLRLALTRWDDAVYAKMKQPWPVPPNAGFLPTPGKLLYQDKGFFRLAYGNNNVGIVYPKCVMVAEPRSTNKGTRHAIATFAVLAQPARIETTVSQVTTVTWKQYYEAASLALAWANLDSLVYT